MHWALYLTWDRCQAEDMNLGLRLLENWHLCVRAPSGSQELGNSHGTLRRRVKD